MQLPCIIAGECYNADPEAIISQTLQIGGGPNVSDANTTNGLPGRCINCSACLGVFDVCPKYETMNVI